MSSLTGALSEGALPTILREIYVWRRTGTLHFRSATEWRSVSFRRGHIVHGSTSRAEEHLGEALVHLGLISQEQLATATEVVKRDHRRLGEVLIDTAALDQAQLEDGIALHVRNILLRVFEWSEGRFEFEEQEEALGQDITLRLSTGELILDAVRAISDPDIVRYQLGDIDRVLGLSSDPLLRFQKLTLSPGDGFVLSRVDGTLSVREVIQLAPLPLAEVQRSLLGLISTGIIEFIEGERKAAPRAAPGPSGSPARGQTVVRSPTPQPIPAPAYAPARASSPTPAPQAAQGSVPSPPPPSPALGDLSPAARQRRDEILELHGALKDKDHYEILGISVAATEAQVKEAYFRLAKRYHPDSHHDSSLSDLHDTLETIFIRLGEAYDVLRNANSRSFYNQALASRKARLQSATAGPTPTGVPAPGPEEDLAARRIDAEAQVPKAEKLFTQEKYWDAIQTLEGAIPALTGRVRHRARVLLALCLLKNPHWVRRAEDLLQTVAQDDPKNVDAHFYLGTIYKERGLRARALSMFRKVVEIDPTHQEAAALVMQFAPPPEAEAARSEPGLFKKLFKRS